MKAQFVYENMEFERGQDPKKSMGIGVEATFRKIHEMMLKDGWTPVDDNLENMLGWAVDFGHADLAKFLLDKSAPNYMDKNIQFLSWAVQNNDKEMVELLLKYGANPYLSGKWVLRMAVMKEYKDIIELLEPYFNPEDIEDIKNFHE